MRRRDALCVLATALAFPLLACAPCTTRAAAPALDWQRLAGLMLRDHAGNDQPLQMLWRDRVTVVQFFFTGCSTVCPPQTALLREARTLLAARPGAREVLFLSISVDPLNDDPPRLRAYAARLGIALGLASGWLMLTPRPADLEALLGGFALPVGAAQDHPSWLWIIDAARQRWTRSPAIAAPHTLAAQIAAWRL